MLIFHSGTLYTIYRYHTSNRDECNMLGDMWENACACVYAIECMRRFSCWKSVVDKVSFVLHGIVRCLKSPS